MPNRLEKTQQMQAGTFLVACVFGVTGVLFDRLELVFIAAFLMAFCFWQVKESFVIVDRTSHRPEFGKINSGRWILVKIWLGLAILFGAAAVYFSTAAQSGTLSFILWLAMIVSLISAGIVFDQIASWLWLKKIKQMPPQAQRRLLIEILLLLLITEIALLLRVTHLNQLPLALHGDEGEVGMAALKILESGSPTSPFGVGWATLPSLFFYLPAGSIFLFGRNEVGLRMVSALFGALSVPLVYLIGRKFWGKIAGFTAAWLLAVSHFNIHYSRLGVNCIEAAFFMILFTLLLLALLSDGEQAGAQNITKDSFTLSPFLFIGIIIGLAQYVGVYSRLIPLIGLPLYMVQLIRKRIHPTQFAATMLAAFLVFAPLGMYYLQNPITFWGRINTVSIFNPNNFQSLSGQSGELLGSLFFVIKNQVLTNLNFYLQSGDNSSFYDVSLPAFDGVTALLFWLGLGVVFSRLRRLPELVLILWLVLGTLAAGVMTNNAPSGTRLLTVSSVVFIIAGIFVQRTTDAAAEFFLKISNARSLHGAKLTLIFSTLLLAALGINLYYYFGLYPTYTFNILPTALAEQIVLASPQNHVYLLGDGEIYANHGSIRFLAGADTAVDIKSLNDLSPLVEDGKGMTIFATLPHFDVIHSIQAYYPQGALSEEYFFGRLIFMKYQIPALPVQ